MMMTRNTGTHGLQGPCVSPPGFATVALLQRHFDGSLKYNWACLELTPPCDRYYACANKSYVMLDMCSLRAVSFCAIIMPLDGGFGNNAADMFCMSAPINRAFFWTSYGDES